MVLVLSTVRATRQRMTAAWWSDVARAYKKSKRVVPENQHQKKHAVQAGAAMKLRELVLLSLTLQTLTEAW